MACWSLAMLRTMPSRYGLPDLPVVLVLAVGDVVALDPLLERERAGADRLVLASGPSAVSLSMMFRTWKKSKTADPRLLGGDDRRCTCRGLLQVVSGGTKPVMMPAVSLRSRMRLRL